jgi:hypothetical protein
VTRVAWWLLLGLALIGLLFAAAAAAQPLRWLSLVELAPSETETATQRQARLARAERAIEAASNERVIRAALAVLGSEETAFAERFARDGCRPDECDGGEAKGYFQAHRGSCPELWDEPRNVELMARCAARHLRYGRALCGSLAGAFSVYMGLECDSEKGRHRAALLDRVLARAR